MLLIIITIMHPTILFITVNLGDIPMQHKERLSEKLDFNAAGQGDKGTTTVKKGDNSVRIIFIYFMRIR